MQAITEAFQMSPAYFYTVVGILGLLIGSFLNVVASRVPKGMSVIHPPSHCESCGHRLSLLDLIPVFSWVASRGKCRYCGESFSIRYALWEAVTGGLFVLTAAVLGPVYELIPGLVLVSMLVAIVQTDLEHMIIPDKIVLFGCIAGVLLRIWIHPRPLWQYGVAFVAGGLILYGIALLGQLLLKKESMGGGDIKLLAVLGLYIGIQGTVLTLFLASVIGLFVSLFLILARIVRKEEPIPFGPYLAMGAYIVYLWGDSLLNGYLHLIVQ
jgi:leader peptidase (prepilin peptidase) / N-methyltransferase